MKPYSLICFLTLSITLSAQSNPDISGWWAICADENCLENEEVGYALYQNDTAHYAFILDGYGLIDVGEPHYYQIKDGFFLSDEPTKETIKVVLNGNSLQLIYTESVTLYMTRIEEPKK